MTRVKGLLFIPLFAFAFAAMPAASQDRGNDQPTVNNPGTDSPTPPKTSPKARRDRQHVDGDRDPGGRAVARVR